MSDRSRRAILREKTSKAHESLDTSIGAFDSLDAYAIYLKGVAAFRIPLETATDDAGSLCAWEHQSIADLIRLDLQDLCLTPAAPTAIPTPAGRDALLGALYVMEGSALGARLLYKRAQSLGLSDVFGARHLAAQAAKSDRWQTFLALLETTDLVEIDTVAQSSDATFAAAQRAFASARPGHMS